MSNSLRGDFLLSLRRPEHPPLGKRCDDAENANDDKINGHDIVENSGNNQYEDAKDQRNNCYQ
jgi:hypothetical protein